MVDPTLRNNIRTIKISIRVQALRMAITRNTNMDNNNLILDTVRLVLIKAEATE